eukprot:IDg6381t1
MLPSECGMHALQGSFPSLKDRIVLQPALEYIHPSHALASTLTLQSINVKYEVLNFIPTLSNASSMSGMSWSWRCSSRPVGRAPPEDFLVYHEPHEQLAHVLHLSDLLSPYRSAGVALRARAARPHCSAFPSGRSKTFAPRDATQDVGGADSRGIKCTESSSDARCMISGQVPTSTEREVEFELETACESRALSSMSTISKSPIRSQPISNRSIMSCRMSLARRICTGMSGLPV